MASWHRSKPKTQTIEQQVKACQKALASAERQGKANMLVALGSKLQGLLKRQKEEQNDEPKDNVKELKTKVVQGVSLKTDKEPESAIRRTPAQVEEREPADDLSEDFFDFTTAEDVEIAAPPLPSATESGLVANANSAVTPRKSEHRPKTQSEPVRRLGRRSLKRLCRRHRREELRAKAKRLHPSWLAARSNRSVNGSALPKTWDAAERKVFSLKRSSGGTRRRDAGTTGQRRSKKPLPPNERRKAAKAGAATAGTRARKRKLR